MTDREAVYIQKNYGLSRYQAAKLVQEADELDQSLRNKRAEERHMIILRRKKHLHELRASLDPRETP